MIEVRFSDVEAFIGEQCAGFRCPACGGTELKPAAEGEGQPIALLYENSPAKSWFGPPGYLRVFALSCASCGYVMIFKLDALHRWLAARAGRNESIACPSGGVRQDMASLDVRPTDPVS